jgi:hypothetical protein
MKSQLKKVTTALVVITVLLSLQIPAFAATQSILGPEVTNYISSRSNTVSIGVYDANTGKTYTYNPSKTYQTASIVKMSMLADVLYKKIPLSSYENSLLTKMIENSDDSAASSIWVQLGSDKNVQTFFRTAGMTNTIAGTGGWWGFTTTNVLDQLTMMKYFAYPNTLLNNSQREYGLNLMRNVVWDQRWGTGYGIPSGVNVALKNGWSNTNQPYNWRINSVGYINGQGKNYVIAVLTINNPTKSYGIETINTISKLVWNEIWSPYVQNAQNIKTLINGNAINGRTQGIIYNGHTHIIWTVLNLLGVPYQYKGNGLFIIDGKSIQGNIYNNETYLQWDQISGNDLIANSIAGGWNFTTPSLQTTQTINTLFNGEPIAGRTQGIVVNGITNIIWPVLNLLDVSYQYKGNGLFIINGKFVQGNIYNNETYLPSDQIIGNKLVANSIAGGFDFTNPYVQNVQTIRALFNGNAIEGKTQGIVHNGTTHIIWKVINQLGVTYQYKGNGLFIIDGKSIQGKIYNNETYLQWDQISGNKLIANPTIGGWNFILSN